MTNHRINIAVSGFSLTTTDELKIQLRHAIPARYGINWINIADPSIDLLFINDCFFETKSIQAVLQAKKFPYLQVSKNIAKGGEIIAQTLFIPIFHIDALTQWVKQHVLMPLEQQSEQFSPHQSVQGEETFFKPLSLANVKQLLNPEQGRLHVFDLHGTLAIVDTRSQVAWLEPTRTEPVTDNSLQYDFASTNDFFKVSRKLQRHLPDWLWNLYWSSPEFLNFAPEDGCYQLSYWPQPLTKQQRKIVLQLSACFIQGAKISEVAQKLDLPMATVRQFIAASLATENARQITEKECGYPEKEEHITPTEKGFLKSFFGKIRTKFGL